MYSFLTIHEKKARSFRKGHWRKVDNPLYLKEFSEVQERLAPKQHILRVYPILYWWLGPANQPYYHGTLILVFAQTNNTHLPGYLIWIDRMEAGDVLYAHDFLDLLDAMHFLKEFVEIDLRTEMYLSSWYHLDSSLYS